MRVAADLEKQGRGIPVADMGPAVQATVTGIEVRPACVGGFAVVGQHGKSTVVIDWFATKEAAEKYLDGRTVLYRIWLFKRKGKR